MLNKLAELLSAMTMCSHRACNGVWTMCEIFERAQ